MNKLRGQTEIIIVFAVIIIALIAVVFIFQAKAPPPGSEVAEAKNLLKAEIEAMIYSASSEIVDKIGRQGGYLDMPKPSVFYAGNNVPYWQACQNKLMPSLDEIKERIQLGLERYLLTIDQNKLSEKYGKVVALDVAGTEVIITDSEVLAKAWVPTKIDGYEIEQPYEARLPVKLKRAYDFAADFIESNSKERHFDRFIASLFYHADPNTFPNMDILTECGEFVFSTWENSKRLADEIIGHSLSHMILWEEPPPEPERTYLDYHITDLEGKKYDDLDIQFLKAGELNYGNFQPSMSPVSIINSVPLSKWVQKCVKDYEITYSLNFPIVAKIKSGDYAFQFAFMPVIADSKIAICENIGNFTAQKDYCAEGHCTASVNVVDSSGRPVPNSQVAFGNCPVGVTGGSGIASGKVPCGIGQLNIYNPSYSSYLDISDSFELKNKNVQLFKNPKLFVHFNKLLISDSASTISQFPLITHSSYSATPLPAEKEDKIYVKFIKKEPMGLEPKEIILSNIIGNITEQLSRDTSQLDGAEVDEDGALRGIGIGDINQTNGTIEPIYSGDIRTGMMVDYISPGLYDVESNIFRTASYTVRYCKKYKGDDCERWAYLTFIVPVVEKASSEFEVRENDTDIYINALTKGFSAVSDVSSVYDYSSYVGIFKTNGLGLGLVSREMPKAQGFVVETRG